MLNLFLAMLPTPSSIRGDGDEGFLGKLALRSLEAIRYRRALFTLGRLDDRDLDDLGIDRSDFPDLARRHAMGAAPLTPSQIASARQH